MIQNISTAVHQDKNVALTSCFQVKFISGRLSKGLTRLLVGLVSSEIAEATIMGLAGDARGTYSTKKRSDGVTQFFLGP